MVLDLIAKESVVEIVDQPKGGYISAYFCVPNLRPPGKLFCLPISYLKWFNMYVIHKMSKMKYLVLVRR